MTELDLRLLDSHMRTTFARKERLASYLSRLGRSLGYRSADFLRESVEAVLAAQTEQARATWELHSIGAELADPYARSLDVDAPVEALIGSATRGGTALETVYSRPGILVAELVSDGISITDSNARASRLVSEMADTDVAVAGRNAERAYMAVDRRIVGYRRVPNVTACDWCKYIATQRYKTSKLAPAHPYCHCGTAPIYGEVDPGPVADEEALREIKKKGVPKKYGDPKADSKRANREISKPEPELPSVEEARRPLRAAKSTDELAEIYAERHPGTTFKPGRFELDEAVDFAEMMEDLETKYPLLPGHGMDSVGELVAVYGARNSGGMGTLGMAQYPLMRNGATLDAPSWRATQTSKLGTRAGSVDAPERMAKAHSKNHFATANGRHVTVHEYGHVLGYSAEAELMDRVMKGQIKNPSKKRYAAPHDVTGKVWEREMKELIRDTLPDVEVSYAKRGSYEYVPTRIADVPLSASWSTWKQAVEQGLSRYGATDPREMMAEALAEFELSDSPRPLARAVVERAQTLIREGTERLAKEDAG